MVKNQSVSQSTNFHSLARDLERTMASCREGPHGARGVSGDEVESSQGRKVVLLEKTNRLHEEQHVWPGEEGGVPYSPGGPFRKLATGKPVVQRGALQLKESAFTEVRWVKEKLKAERAREMGPGGGEARFGMGLVRCSSGSAFSFVWPARAAGELRSAFSKPAKGLAEGRAVATSQPQGDPAKLPGCISATDFAWCGSSLWTSRLLASDLSGSPLLQASPFPPLPGLWPRQAAEPGPAGAVPAQRTSSTSLALLPPTFASFAVAAQNWCAKCNLAFCMTSDLVFHMRSHHKKEGALPESRGRRRRGEGLACPVCREYFRERHHLSRHMTSHN
ncbi:zinc finger protein 488 [Varanus komodoensis]|uniref:zinc finger protein 488 n=1 Tax=Varanus komodoensis TaxID=61221 RepID=UPI001CF7E5E3|nr:zinc finger protein 488 [Varanus komodoensis]